VLGERKDMSHLAEVDRHRIFSGLRGIWGEGKAHARGARES
jgi:hypothetical protein